MRLILIQEAPCAPVSLEEARNHLAIDYTTRADDNLIRLLIEAASADAEDRTGRIWVESLWEWSEDNGFQVGFTYQFPTVPVTKVQIFDTDEVIPEGGEATDLSGSLVKCNFPSPHPQGSPMIGSLLPINEFPTNHRVVLTVGYPVEETVIDIEPCEEARAPVLDIPKITYAKDVIIGYETVEIAPEEGEEPTTEEAPILRDVIHLVFSREVQGEAEPSTFKVEVQTLSSVGEIEFVEYMPSGLQFVKGGVSLEFPQGFLIQSMRYRITFIGGMIYDTFNNFVDMISPSTSEEGLFQVDVIGTEEDFIEPNKIPTRLEYTSKAPARIKEWIMTRTNTLYSQKSEIALRAGKSNDALFDERFIDIILQPFKVEFV